MGLHLLAEAVLRIEHKVDAIVRHLKVQVPLMHFTAGQQCPVCHHNIEFVIDVQHQIVVRRCNCKTGKVPSTIPLIPVVEQPSGRQIGRTEDPQRVVDSGATGTDDRPGRKTRQPGSR